MYEINEKPHHSMSLCDILIEILQQTEGEGAVPCHITFFNFIKPSYPREYVSKKKKEQEIFHMYYPLIHMYRANINRNYR